jgi:hypothetical protein
VILESLRVRRNQSVPLKSLSKKRHSGEEFR